MNWKSRGRVGLAFLVMASAGWATEPEQGAVAEEIPREWKSAENGRVIRATFVSCEEKQVTLRLTGGEETVVALATLSQADRDWVEARAAELRNPALDEKAVFDRLKFGDSRATVLEKLKASPAFELTVDEVFIARLGMNGVFRSREEIGGMRGILSFGWSESGTLQEITLQTETRPASDYQGAVKDAWTGMAELLTNLYGKPAQATSFPEESELELGTFLGSHLWKTRHGSILLGSSFEGRGYSAVTRFTQRRIDPNATP